jgi:hypothetical protein
MLTNQATRDPFTSVVVGPVVLERVRSDVAEQMLRRHPMVDTERQRRPYPMGWPSRPTCLCTSAKRMLTRVARSVWPQLSW